MVALSTTSDLAVYEAIQKQGFQVCLECETQMMSAILELECLCLFLQVGDLQLLTPGFAGCDCMRCVRVFYTHACAAYYKCVKPSSV